MNLYAKICLKTTKNKPEKYLLYMNFRKVKVKGKRNLSVFFYC